LTQWYPTLLPRAAHDLNMLLTQQNYSHHSLEISGPVLLFGKLRLVSEFSLLYSSGFAADAKRKVTVGEECVINVDKTHAGPGNITCHITTPSGQDAGVDIEDNRDGTVSIYYTPRMTGKSANNQQTGVVSG